MRALKLLLGVAALLLAAGAAAFAWLTAREPVPEHTDYVLDPGELRRLAEVVPGPPPSELRSELVAETFLPRGALYAGESLLEPHPMVHQVFQAVWPDGRTLLVDAGFPEALLARMGEGGSFRRAGFERVLRALRRADLVVVTHEHFDHLAGVAACAPAELAGRLHLTREQLANARALDEAGLAPELRSAAPLAYERLHPLAPGVVLVKAPGHTPGSQLVYVRTADGHEWLFVGDVAWHGDQLARLHYRPRLVTDFFLGEDRAAVLGQFRALHERMRAQPDLRVVVSHDRDQRARLLAEGLLRDQVAPSASAPAGRAPGPQRVGYTAAPGAEQRPRVPSSGPGEPDRGRPLPGAGRGAAAAPPAAAPARAAARLLPLRAALHRGRRDHADLARSLLGAARHRDPLRPRPSPSTPPSWTSPCPRSTAARSWRRSGGCARGCRS